VLRFLVGLGVGGEWAVAAAAVAEVFPPRARPTASGIFHASSVLGTYLAVAAGLLTYALDRETGWRWGFVLGVVPALLILWVRVSMREPERWQSARAQAAQGTSHRLGRFTDLFTRGTLLRHTLLATALAAIGLATFWGAHFRGKDLLRQAEQKRQREQFVLPALAASITGLIGSPSPSSPLLAAVASPGTADALQDKGRIKFYEMLGMLLATTGGGIGLLSFAPISQRLGRRGAFALFHLGGFLLVALAVAASGSVPALIAVLPVFGFFTLGMHAGYAVYFPELFPTRLRGTGAGFCFNTARIVVGPILILFALLQGNPLNLGLGGAMMVLGALFLVGAVLVYFAPETRGRPLPD
jgi:MFS family permease